MPENLCFEHNIHVSNTFTVFPSLILLASWLTSHTSLSREGTNYGSYSSVVEKHSNFAFSEIHTRSPGNDSIHHLFPSSLRMCMIQ